MTSIVEFPALKEAQGTLNAKRKALAEIFAEAGPDYDMSKVKSVSGDTHAKVDHIRTLNTEIDACQGKVDELMVVAKAAAAARHGQDKGAGESGSEPDARQAKGAEPGVKKSLGEMFVDSRAFKEYRRGSSEGPTEHFDIEVKSLFETGAGWQPEVTRTGRMVEMATRPIQVIDFIPGTTTSQSSVQYMEETTFVNNAAETAEGAQYPEAQLELTEKDSPVRKIAVWLPVTDEQLEDVPQARGYVNNRLPFMLRQRLDQQILTGSGTAPNLRGLGNTTGVLTQAKGADPVPDAIYKAMVRVMTEGRAMPNLVILNPLDWQDIRLLRTADGIYIWGSPSDAGPERIWGLPVAKSDAQTENTGLVLDTSFTELATRRGVDVQISNAHSDFFIRGKQAVRADMRMAFIVYRPAAVAKVTGI